MAEGTVFNIQRFSLHDGPGIRTVVFLKGCPLRCHWCANPESQSPACQTASDGTAYGERLSDAAVWRVVERDIPFYEESGGGLTLSGGEPLMQPDFSCALLERVKAAGLHTAVETTGFAPFSVIERLAPHADLWLYDVKHHDGAAHRAGTGVDNAQIVENLKALVASGAEVVARIPVIPGFNDSLSDAGALASLLVSAGVCRADILPFHQMGEKKYQTLGMAYALAGAKPLRAEALAPYQAQFLSRGIDTRM
jgi:pyruvate formate lyase activating enzyme